MSDNPDNQTPNKGVNPIIAIGTAVTIGLVLSGVSLLTFLDSDAREIINIKEESLSASQPVLSDNPDESSDLTSSSLDSIEDGIKNTVADIDAEDFSSSEMTDAALGL